jgi:hypothetical protein
MFDFLKPIGVILTGIAIFLISNLKAKLREVENENEGKDSEIENLKENAKINKDVANTTFSELSDGLLAKQKKRRKK